MTAGEPTPFPSLDPEPLVPSHRDVLRLAWPIVLANAAVPLLGLADTAVIGNVGTVAELGAIALGALVFSFVYWSFGFLRMGTTGFTAQAAGAGDEAEVRATLGRALLLGLGIGLALVLLQRPIGWAAFSLLGGGVEVEAIARDYFAIRIWGAPAALATFAILGTLVGLGRSDLLLRVQLILNGLNIGLDVLFAGGFAWGVRGIALGTLAAEWITLGFALRLAARLLRERHADGEPFWPWSRLRDRDTTFRTLGANADILVRTLLLMFGFAWFTDRSAQLGDTVLAANHILLQLVTLTAFLLDGYAFAAEPLVGRAVGARRRDAFDAAVRRTTELAAAGAVLLAAAMLLAGDRAVAALTDLAPVRDLAESYLPHAALYVLLSFAAFQLDGIFLGATRTRALRNAAAVSLALFLAAAWPLVERAGNEGLWLAFVLYVVFRAAALAAAFPALRRSLG